MQIYLLFLPNYLHFSSLSRHSAVPGCHYLSANFGGSLSLPPNTTFRLKNPAQGFSWGHRGVIVYATWEQNRTFMNLLPSRSLRISFLTRLPEPLVLHTSPYRGVCIRTKASSGILSNVRLVPFSRSLAGILLVFTIPLRYHYGPSRLSHVQELVVASPFFANKFAYVKKKQ